MFDSINKAAGDALNKSKIEAIEKAILSSGVGVSGLAVSFSDGTASVKGSVDSSSDSDAVVAAIKNVDGVSDVNNGLSVSGGSGSSGGGGGQSYTVASGDTLSAIAQKFYGDSSQYMKIYEANKATIGGNPDMIQVGQNLLIP